MIRTIRMWVFMCENTSNLVEVLRIKTVEVSWSTLMESVSFDQNANDLVLIVIYSAWKPNIPRCKCLSFWDIDIKDCILILKWKNCTLLGRYCNSMWPTLTWPGDLERILEEDWLLSTGIKTILDFVHSSISLKVIKKTFRRPFMVAL